MTRPDLDLLLSLVDKATPGPWKAITPPWQRGWVHGPNSVEVADCFDAQNARYLAALDPETVRSLIHSLKPPYESAILAAVRETIWAERGLLAEVRAERDAALARLEKARGLVLEFAANMGPGFFDSYPTLVKLRAALTGTSETLWRDFKAGDSSHAALAQELADLKAKHREVEAARDAALAQLREREEVARLGSTVRPPLAPGAGS